MFRWLFEYVKALLPQFSFSPLLFLVSLFHACREAQVEPAPGMNQRNGPHAGHCQTHKWNKLKFVAEKNKKRRLLKVTVIIFHPATSEVTYSSRVDGASFFCSVWLPAWQLSMQVPSSESTWAQLSVSHPNDNWREMEGDGGSARVVWGTQQSRSSRGCPLNHKSRLVWGKTGITMHCMELPIISLFMQLLILSVDVVLQQ